MNSKQSTSNNNSNLSRRAFIRGMSLTSAAAIAAALTERAAAEKPPSKRSENSKTLNYNARMGYRRLGKTGLMLSEVSLGGHFKDRRGDRYWDEFPDEKVPEDVAKNRIDVISACIDAGINYVDLGTSAECLAYGVALKGRRDKMYVGADDFKLTARRPENCKVDKLTFDIDQCCRRLQSDYLDIWRVKADMYGESTDAHVETIIETFEKARKAGKVRFLAVSSHNRPWLQHIVESFEQFDVVSFPVSVKTREKGRPPAKGNIEEVNAGYGADTTQSIFEAVRRKNVGVIAIKPFLGGKLFDSNAKFPVKGPGDKTQHDLARLTLRCILANQAVTATVPGLTTLYELENAIRASYMRSLGQTAAEKAWLNQITEKRWAELPVEYQWLRDWQLV